MTSVLKIFFVIVTGAMLFATPAMAQSAADMDILAEKIKADKKLLVASNMKLTDAESKNFWPLYDAYQVELDILNKRLVKVIEEYANAYNKGPVPNKIAAKLIKEYLAVETEELKMRISYTSKIGKVLPATKTARYLQIETKIRALVKFDLAREVPLMY